MYVTISSVCGIISPLVGIVFILIAASKSPWFHWTEEDLSVLGVNGAATSFFIWGLVLSALLNTVFVIGLVKSQFVQNRQLGRIGVISLILGSVALCLTGLIPRTIAVPHNVVSIAFFTLIPLGVFIIGISLVKSAQLLWGLFSIAIVILMVGLYLTPWPWRGGAILQLISILPWALWMVIIAAKLLMRSHLKL